MCNPCPRTNVLPMFPTAQSGDPRCWPPEPNIKDDIFAWYRWAKENARLEISIIDRAWMGLAVTQEELPVIADWFFSPDPM